MGSDASEFVVQADNCSDRTIPPLESSMIEIVFSPVSWGPKSAYLIIPSNDPDNSTINVQITGMGAVDIHETSLVFIGLILLAITARKPSTVDKSQRVLASDQCRIDWCLMLSSRYWFFCSLRHVFIPLWCCFYWFVMRGVEGKEGSNRVFTYSFFTSMRNVAPNTDKRSKGNLIWKREKLVSL